MGIRDYNLLNTKANLLKNAIAIGRLKANPSFIVKWMINRMSKIILSVFLAFLVACAAPPTPEILATSTPISTETTTATVTTSPTPEPTPTGGGGRIVLTAPYELYKGTHPELGEGRHLFLFDLSDNSLTPLTSTADAYNILTGVSPNGDFLIFESSSASLYMQNCSFYLMDLTSGDLSKINGASNESNCQNSANRPTWLSENALAYLAADTNGISHIYIYDPYSRELGQVTPDDKRVCKFTVVTPNGPFFWTVCGSGHYQTSVSGETVELEVDIVHENAPQGSGKWIYQEYDSEGAAIGALDYFMLTSPEDNKTVHIQDLFYDKYVPNFGVGIWEWSPDQNTALIYTYIRGQDPSVQDRYLWDIEENTLVDFPIEGDDMSWSPAGETILIASYDESKNETMLQKYSVGVVRLQMQYRLRGPAEVQVSLQMGNRF